MTAMSRSPDGGPGEHRVSRAIPRASVAGTCIALARRAVLAVLRAAPALPLVAGSPLTAGCITQDLRFIPPENFPPSIEVPAGGGYPLDEIIRLRADELGGGGDAGSITTLFIEVEVRDPDVDQDLQYKVFVDYQRGVAGQGPIIGELLPPRSSMDPDRRSRPVTLPVPVGAVREPGCHRIELLVSERFQSPSAEATGREPLAEGDLGTAVWWVATQATEGDAVDMTGCR